VWPQHVGQHGLGGLRLGFAVPLLVHDRGIDAEGDIVDKQAVPHGGVVDASFNAVAKGMEAETRILPVDPEVQSEMVSRPRRDAHEGKIVLDGDGGDEGLGTVAAGHAQTVGAVSDGVPGQLLKVEAMVEQDHLYSETLGQFDKAEPRHLSPAGPRIADQYWALRASDRDRPTMVMLTDIAQERGPGQADGTDQEHGHQHQTEQWSITVGGGPDDGQDHQGQAGDAPGDSDAPTGHPLGCRPPHAGHRHGQPNYLKNEKPEIVKANDDERCGQEQAAAERTQRQAALAPGDSMRCKAPRSRRRLHPLPPAGQRRARGSRGPRTRQSGAGGGITSTGPALTTVASS
jgi:hypothetical protein